VDVVKRRSKPLNDKYKESAHNSEMKMNQTIVDGGRATAVRNANLTTTDSKGKTR
jgi:hypothetical protein